MEKEFWVDFVEGEISMEEMLRRIKENEKLITWMNSVVSSDEKMTIVKEIVKDNGYKDFEVETINFEVKGYIQEELKSKNTTLGKYLNIFSTFSDILIKAFPEDNIEIDTTLEKRFKFILDACPEYIGGIKADEIIDNYYKENPNISKKQFKDEIKNIFNIEKSKYPKWVQSPEWPVSNNGKPMRFVKQNTDKNTQITRFVFEDVDTKQETVIEQFI